MTNDEMVSKALRLARIMRNEAERLERSATDISEQNEGWEFKKECVERDFEDLSASYPWLKEEPETKKEGRTICGLKGSDGVPGVYRGSSRQSYGDEPCPFSPNHGGPHGKPEDA